VNATGACRDLIWLEGTSVQLGDGAHVVPLAMLPCEDVAWSPRSCEPSVIKIDSPFMRASSPRPVAKIDSAWSLRSSVLCPVVKIGRFLEPRSSVCMSHHTDLDPGDHT
jgi:hypothetical protein